MLTQPWRTIAQLFLQQPCPLCERSTPQVLCPTCWQQLQLCAHGQPAKPDSEALPVLSWGRYQGALKRAIAALKYDHQTQLAWPLGQALGQHWQQLPLPTRCPPVVVPIPLHPHKLKTRGFNQAELLAAAFCEYTQLPLVSQGLMRHRDTLPQFGLGLAARQQNLAGALALGPAFSRTLPDRPVLLCDDIYTTGTTVRTAAATLRRHGISVCGVVAIAQAALEH